MSNNTITLCGRVGQAPVSKTTRNGKTVVSFPLGVKEYSPDGDDTTMWIEVELWNGLGERAAKVVTKGRELVVAGRLLLNKYEKQMGGTSFTMTKAAVRAGNFHLCGPKPAANHNEAPADNGRDSQVEPAAVSEPDGNDTSADESEPAA